MSHVIAGSTTGALRRSARSAAGAVPPREVAPDRDDHIRHEQHRSGVKALRPVERRGHGVHDHDVEGASHNGIDCIGVTWGFGSVDELAGAGAAITVDTPGEVAAAVAATYRSVRP